MARGRLPARVVLAYGLPGLVSALPVIPVSILLPSHYAITLGLGLSLTGAVLGAARLLDFCLDLVVGIGVDRQTWRGRRYKHWVLIGALTAFAALVQLSFPPAAVDGWYLGAWSLLLFAGWTLLTIPYTAWGADLTDDLHERSLLAASREIAGVVGMLCALMLPLFAPLLGIDTARSPLLPITLAALVLGVPALYAALRHVPEPPLSTAEPGRLLAELRALFAMRAVRGMLFCWLLNGMANGLPAVLFPLVVKGYFHLDERGSAILLVLYFLSAILASPLWLTLARGIGKRPAWAVAILCNVAVFAPVMWLAPVDVNAFVAVCVLSGATLGADLALPVSIQADIVAAGQAQGGAQRTASAFALWTMATKLALGLAVASAFIVLGESAGGEGGEVAPGLLLGLYAGLPLALKCAVLWLLRSSTRFDAPADQAQAGADDRKMLV